MNILAVDQARHCGYSVWDYENKKLKTYGSYNFPNGEYDFPQAVFNIEKSVENLIKINAVAAVFIEDINLRANPSVFKSLAQLQGVLINSFVKSNMLYDVIQPSQWQAFCGARGRSSKELKSNILTLNTEGKKASKVLSIEYVHYNFGVETQDDNIADAICIGNYAVNNIKIKDYKEKN